jgi:hypothetical protein
MTFEASSQRRSLASDERARSAAFKKIPTHRREQNMKQK